MVDLVINFNLVIIFKLRTTIDYYYTTVLESVADKKYFLSATDSSIIFDFKRRTYLVYTIHYVLVITALIKNV